MSTVAQLITRSQLREELQLVLQHYATKADLAKLDTKISELKFQIVSWMVGMMLVFSSVVVSAVIAVVKLWN